MALFPFPPIAAFSFSSKPNGTHLIWELHRYPPRRNLIFACSAEKNRKKRRTSRAAMTNEELCSEIRKLAASVGQPEDWVPSTKELCEHGRKDLANIVRRKGYKLITELLRNTDKRDYGIEEVSLEDGDSNIGIDEPSEIEGRNLIKSTEFISTFDSPLAKTYEIGNGAVNIDVSVHRCDPSESFNGSLHLKAANFIKTGELGTTEDAFKIENVDTPTQPKVNSDILSSNVVDAVHVAFQQALPLLAMQDLGRDHSASNVGSNGDNENVASEDGEMDNQTEIDHLKAMLNQKEMELSELKQQIEKEKQVLYILQDKAKHEIGSIHRSVSAKDFELRAVEESLSGLKEVQIEYWADGGTVEVAGSFNGWHHRIKMDLNSSSRTINSPASRNSKLWSAVLWLYPGFYEIKFIVDGQWRVDSRREMITIGNVTNNVLRVER